MFILLRTASEVEVMNTIWDCDGNKCRGPGGFTLCFSKDTWSILKPDIMCFFDEFHWYGRIVKGENASPITLIPNKGSSQQINDFRLISLNGFM